MNVLAIEASQQQDDVFAIFDDSATLSLIVGGTTRPIATLPSIQALDKPIAMSISKPHVCVVERFGVHGAVVDLATGLVRTLEREDYCARASSFPHAFLHRDGRPLLLHQTQWNRLDVMDL